MRNNRIVTTAKSSLIAVCLAMPISVSACLNETGTDRNGNIVAVYNLTHKDLKQELLAKESPAEKKRMAGYAIEEAKKKPGINALNDLAVSLIRYGRHESAIKHLLLIEKKSPGRYATATNLGTAYELIGNNTEALRWIKIGIERNQAAHFGTEWLHARILEAKIRKETSSNISILKLDFGRHAQPLLPKNMPPGNDGKPVSLFNLGRALRYQLLERTEFVDAPEPIVAGLLFDWANLEARSGTLESAEILYDIALEYGYPDKKLVSLRQAEVQRILKLPRKSSKTKKECELCIQPEISGEEEKVLDKHYRESRK